MLEEYIQGREIQVGILEDRALPSIEIIPKQGFYDYANKYQPGAALEVCPAEIPRSGRRSCGPPPCGCTRPWACPSTPGPTSS